jgi:hypothetical protein
MSNYASGPLQWGERWQSVRMLAGTARSGFNCRVAEFRVRATCAQPALGSQVDFLRIMANYNYAYWSSFFTDIAHAPTVTHRASPPLVEEKRGH